MEQITLAGGAGVKVGGMEPPPTNDRRAVPRHIRDAEHDTWHDEPAGPETAGRRMRLWVYLTASAALAVGLWYFLTTRP